MRNLLVASRLVLSVCLLVGFAHKATAQGYALNLLDAAQRGSEWFAGESLDLRGHGRSSVGLVYDWAHRPLVAAARGERERAIVRNQMLVQPGVSVILWERLRLALDIPVLVYSDGRSIERDGVRYDAPPGRMGLADVRLGVLLRLFGSYRGPLTAALGVNVSLPTGAEDAYTGDGAVRVLPQLLLAGEVQGFAYAGRLGVGLRGASHDLLGAHHGHYAYFALSLGVRMFERFVLGPELFGRTGLGERELWKRRTTPVEALLGMHYSFDNGMRLGVGIGFGVSEGQGAPERRGIASLEWNAPARKPQLVAATYDRDADGIPDHEDACADRPGPRTLDTLRNGCPRELDSDGDSIIDPLDACPDHPGALSDNPEQSGCPKPKDTDQDGIPEAQDACPSQPGQPSADPQTTGCPDPDPTR